MILNEIHRQDRAKCGVSTRQAAQSAFKYGTKLDSQPGNAEITKLEAPKTLSIPL